MDMPMVSVLMKVYNGQRYLREAIDSILAQTYHDFELVVIDDGSTDDSVEIIKTYSDSRIRFIQNKKNLGLCATQNKVIEAARGKYLAVMDCDDISYPMRLERQVEFLETHLDVMMCGTFRNNIIDEKECFFQKPQNLSNETLQFSLVFANFFFTHSSIMFRANEYRDSDLSYGPAAIAEDYQIIIEMAKRYPIAMIPESLVGYRIDQQSISHVKKKEITEAARQVKADYVQTLQIDCKNKQILEEYFKMGYTTISVNDFIEAMQAVANIMNADITASGEAYEVSCNIIMEYILRKANYSRKMWKQLKKSNYPSLVSLKTSVGWKIFIMCLLGYKRKI